MVASGRPVPHRKLCSEKAQFNQRIKFGAEFLICAKRTVAERSAGFQLLSAVQAFAEEAAAPIRMS